MCLARQKTGISDRFLILDCPIEVNWFPAGLKAWYHRARQLLNVLSPCRPISLNGFYSWHGPNVAHFFLSLCLLFFFFFKVTSEE